MEPTPVGRTMGASQAETDSEQRVHCTPPPNPSNSGDVQMEEPALNTGEEETVVDGLDSLETPAVEAEQQYSSGSH